MITFGDDPKLDQMFRSETAPHHLHGKQPKIIDIKPHNIHTVESGIDGTLIITVTLFITQ